jgi:predicted N-formylglutamate amidohydrolase
MSGKTAIVVTCEHASRAVPPALRQALASARDVLATHRGWDPGALPFAEALAKSLHAPILAGTVSRLVIDLNRSPHNPRRFSEWTRALDRSVRDRLDREIHAPHFDAVRKACARTGTIVHIAVHSFDPTLSEDRGGVDIGVLYDPGRPLERAIGPAWARALSAAGLHTRRNFPYHGAADGLATWLRRRFSPSRYAGFELELSQAWSTDARARARALPRVLEGLREAIVAAPTRGRAA